MKNDNITSVDQIYSLLKDGQSIYDKVSYSHPSKTNGKVKNIQLGRLFINLLLPDDFRLVDESLTGKQINNILNEINYKYPPNKVEEITRKINEECLKISSFYPTTFNLETLKLPNSIIKKKKDYLSADMNPEEFHRKVNELGDEFVEYLKEIDSGVYDINKAGVAKSSTTDLANFFIAKGPVINFSGELSKPILNCLNNGFTLDEYYASGEQGRYANFIRASG
jgi:hypothetical protein